MVIEETKINVKSNLNKLSWLNLSVTRATLLENTDFFYSVAHDDRMYKSPKQWNRKRAKRKRD